MIKSQLILDVLELFPDGEKESEFLKKQIGFLSISEIEYTGFGAFVSFQFDEEIHKYKVNMAQEEKSSKSNEMNILSGIEIKNLSLNIEANVTVRMEKGIIESIEIFNYNGHEYPESELMHYEVSQNWKGYSKKIIR